MHRTPHSTGIANQGLNVVDENLEDVELDPQSDPGTQTDYPIIIVMTTINSKLVWVYASWDIPINLTGQYIVIALNATLTGIDRNHIIGVRKVINVVGYDNNSLLIEADAEATASGNQTIDYFADPGGNTFRIKPILSIMPNKTIRFYVNTDDNGMKNLNVRYHEDGIDYHTDLSALNV